MRSFFYLLICIILNVWLQEVSSSNQINESELPVKIYIIAKNTDSANSVKEAIKDSFNQTQISEAQIIFSNKPSNILAHRTVWNHLLKQDYNKVLIFEEKIKIEPNFKKNLKNLLEVVPQNFDIVFLDIGMDLPPVSKTYFVEPQFWLDHFTSMPSIYYAKLKPSSNLWGFHAYYINKESAKTLLQLTEDTNKPMHTAIIKNQAHNLNLYISKIKLLSGTYTKADILSQSTEIQK